MLLSQLFRAGFSIQYLPSIPPFLPVYLLKLTHRNLDLQHQINLNVISVLCAQRTGLCKLCFCTQPDVILLKIHLVYKSYVAEVCKTTFVI